MAEKIEPGDVVSFPCAGDVRTVGRVEVVTARPATVLIRTRGGRSIMRPIRDVRRASEAEAVHYPEMLA